MAAIATTINELTDEGNVIGFEVKSDGVYINYNNGADTVSKKLGSASRVNVSWSTIVRGYTDGGQRVTQQNIGCSAVWNNGAVSASGSAVINSSYWYNINNVRNTEVSIYGMSISVS